MSIQGSSPHVRISRKPRWATFLLLLLTATAAAGQVAPPVQDFPGNRDFSLETPGETRKQMTLPPPPSAPPESLPLGLSVLVREIAVEGNTVLMPEALGQVLASFVDRQLSSEDLETLRDALTQLYVQAGFVNSRATLPDQDLAGGILQVRIIEGRLGDVVIRGQRGYRANYLRSRLLGEVDRPLNAFELEERLRALEAEKGIQSLRASLRPGALRDRAVLHVEISETTRLRAKVEAGNTFSPLIGEEGGHLSVAYLNPVGLGDEVHVSTGLSEGLTDVTVGYELPLGRWGTRLALDFRYSDTRIVDESIAALDIESRYLTAAIDLNQSLWSWENSQLGGGIRAEWRESHSQVGGFDFRFSDAADDRGYVRDFVLRVYQSWTARKRSQVLALRSTWSVGLDVLDATSGTLDRADFAAWLGQFQWLRRVESNGLEFLIRGNVQLALDPLLPFERFSVGGLYSVRGYRENEFVRDNGYSLGFEARLPLLRTPSGHTLLRAGPFVDIGRSWNEKRRDGGEGTNLASLGVAIVWSPHSRLRAEFSYGARLIEVENSGESSIQDHGIAFRIFASTF